MILTVTETAGAALRTFLGKLPYDAVATIAWSEGDWVEDQSADDGMRSLGPGWGVGFYERKKIPQEQVVTISGIDFYFDQGSISLSLSGMTLDYRDGQFVVA